MSLATRLRRSHRLPGSVRPGDVVATAHEVGVELGGHQVLDQVSVEIRAGEVLALVGPNGAGKSTFLSVLTGDTHPQRGRIELFDRPLSAWSNTEAAMRRAVLLQSVTVSFPFTVAEVVQMGRAPWSGTHRADDDDAAVAEAMAQTDVAGFSDRRFGSLSGGEKARVALARVLAQRAPILLLDEPTAALDLHHQELVLGVARDRAAAGDAVVVVVHDLNLAAAYADTVAVLAGGRLVAAGGPDAVLTGPLLSDVYHHDVEVVAHPRTSEPIILPRRPARGTRWPAT